MTEEQSWPDIILAEEELSKLQPQVGDLQEGVSENGENPPFFVASFIGTFFGMMMIKQWMEWETLFSDKPIAEISESSENKVDPVVNHIISYNG
jgi:hypothetical protein